MMVLCKKHRQAWVMHKILVTGGAGYIGSHACKALSAAGFTPVSFDNLVYGHREAVLWGPLVEGDLLDRAAIAEAIRQYQPIAVLHFAAYAYVGESVENPGKYYRNNVVGTLNLLEAMRDAGMNKIIFSSTCATYGLPQQALISETHPQNPINPYGSSKLMIERVLQDFDAAHGLRSISMRYFNAAGADMEAQIGEAHDPETHLIPLVLDAAAGLRESITVNGNDYPTPDGSCIRDYVHVSDLADGHVLALQSLLGGAASAAYNLGNGQGFSVFEVIETAKTITGRSIVTKLGSRRAGDPPQLAGDAGLIKKELGWSPRYSSLSDIIGSAWRWHQLEARRK
jgi:UDP-arabinose 4-epimerase